MILLLYHNNTVKFMIEACIAQLLKLYYMYSLEMHMQYYCKTFLIAVL